MRGCDLKMCFISFQVLADPGRTLRGLWVGQALRPRVDPVLIRLEGLIILPAVIDTVRNAPLCVSALSEVESF